MTAQSSTIVQRVWNYCNVLRDDGMSYGDYLEQLTYLLFLKMDDENVQVLARQSAIPEAYNWQSLLRLDGDALESHYRAILAALGTGSGLIPVIFRKAQNKIQDPAKLRRLIDLIDGEVWTGLGIDTKGEIYEGLLEKNAQDTKSGAGQYFTPRPLIRAIVDVMDPRPGQTLCDPACGTGGFLLAAHDYIAEHYKPLDREQWRHLQHDALHGWEIVDNTARLCVMNLYLHGIGAPGASGLAPDTEDGATAVGAGTRFVETRFGDLAEVAEVAPALVAGLTPDAENASPALAAPDAADVGAGTRFGELAEVAPALASGLAPARDATPALAAPALGVSPIHVSDSLASDPGERFELVLTNPPFGKKSSVTFVNEEGETQRESQVIVRDDFWTSTSNKQLNFVQHVKTILKMHGRAAVVVPDNVLFEGGAGEVVRRKLLHECDVHTLLRLPTGIFYAQGVKANVLFFDRKPAGETPWTQQLWIYDFRTNVNFTLKQNPLTRGTLDEFVACYHAANRRERTPTWSEANQAGRWRAYTYDELMARDKLSLDIFWLRDESLEDSANLPEPDVLAREIMEDLQAALEQFAQIAEDLKD